MKVNKYPDGTSYVSINEGSFPIHDTFRINSYEDLWRLNQLVDVCNHNKPIVKPIITIPNLIDAQADRRFRDNQSSGLKLVCKFLNGMNAKFRIFHPHNAEVVEALMDNVEIVDNSSFINSVFTDDDFRDKVLKDDLILMSSDAGGFKSLMKLCDSIGWEGETYSASKARTESGMVQLIDRQDFGGKDVMIVDDISVFGGTFKGLSNLLRDRNCGKLYLAVSHMTVKDLGHDPVTNYFDKVFTTNSKFDSYYGNNKGGVIKEVSDILLLNLEIIKMF